MGKQFWALPLDPFHTAVGASFGTFTTFQDVSPSPLPLLYGWQLRPGDKLELEAEGEFSTTGTPTLQLGFIYNATAGAAGGTTLAASGAITTGTTAAAWPFHIKWRGTVTAIGSSGSVTGEGVLDLGTSLTAFASSALPVTAAARAVTIDTTVTARLGVGAAWGTSSASNTVKVNNFSALLLN